MLLECRECRGKVSTNARSCPHCGARFFRYPRWWHWAAYAVVLAAFIYWINPIMHYSYWGAKQGVAYLVNLWASGSP